MRSKLLLPLAVALYSCGGSASKMDSGPPTRDAGEKVDAAALNAGNRDDAGQSTTSDAGSDGGADGLPRFLPIASFAARADFNHSAEVTIAAHGDTVVAAAIHMRFATPDSFDPHCPEPPAQVRMQTIVYDE